MNIRFLIYFISAALISFKAVSSESFTESSINKKRGYIETIVKLDIYEVRISAPPNVDAGVLLPNLSSSPIAPRDLYAEIESRRLKYYPNYDLGIAIGPIGDNKSSEVGGGNAVNASLEPRLINYKLSGEVFTIRFTLAKDQVSSYGPTSIFGNNANGVVTFVYSTSGTTQLDIMEGDGRYVFKALTNKGYGTTNSSVGYPGRYGSMITCV